jgi:uncharacterized repeat protein (TIGR01451 family)
MPIRLRSLTLASAALLLFPAAGALAQDPGAWNLGDYSNQLQDCRTLDSGSGAAPFLFPEDYVAGTPVADRTCDSWQTDALERPVSADQGVYYPGLDIERVMLGAKPGWLFFGIDVAEIGPTGSLNDFFGFELDVDGDTRGDYYVEVKSPANIGPAGAWSQKQVAVYHDADGTIGGPNPLGADGVLSQNGYETSYWIVGDRKTEYRRAQNAVWARIRADQPTVVEVAVDPKLLRDPSEVTFRGWVAKGQQNQSRDTFYLHDSQSADQFGSPYPDVEGYPPSSLYQVDNSGPVGAWLEPARPSLSITKSVDQASIGAPGALAYTIEVENTGNVTLADVVVTDPLAGGAAPLAPVSGDGDGDGALGVGETWTYAAGYAVTQADIDAGTDIVNTATVDTDRTEPQSAEATTTITQAPSLELTMTPTWTDDDGDGAADPTDGDGIVQAGELVTVAFTVRNTGNVTLTNVAVASGDVAVSGSALESLAPGASDATTFTGAYALAQADVDAGTFDAAASATSNESEPAPANAATPIAQVPQLGLVNTATVDSGVISYTYVATNSGNVTLFDVLVDESTFTGTGPLPDPTRVSGGADLDGEADALDLAPGADITFSVGYTVTQDDVDAGGVTNQAVATSSYTDAFGTTQSVTDLSDDTSPAGDSPTDTPLAQAPSLELVKAGVFQDEDGDGLASVGETIAYAFTVTNTGNVTLTNVTVTDPLVAVSGGPIVLAPGASDATTFSASYPLTAADLAAGGVVNTATADSDESAPDESSVTTDLLSGIPFVFNEDGLPGIEDGSDFADLEAAFSTWEDVPGASVAFRMMGTTPDRYAANDGVNLVTFRDDAFPFPPYVLAIASKTIVAGEVVDADIVFNPRYVDDPLLTFRTSTSAGNVDIWSTGVHEVGHVISMLHSGVPDATMFFQLQPANEARTLEADDVAWARRRYPADGALATLGSISGRVLDGDQPSDARGGVAGALLLAREEGTGDLFHTYSDADGYYAFLALPPGSYLVSVQPLDGDVGPLDDTARYPMSAANVSAELRAIAVNTTFIPEYWNDTLESDDPEADLPASSVPVPVAAGGEAADIDIVTNADRTPPAVVGFIPAPGATVPTTTDIVISFSEPIDGSSLTFTFQDVTAGPFLTGTLTLHNDNTLGIFVPDGGLVAGRSYQMTVGSGLTDQRGTIQTESFTSSFQTVAAGTPGFVVDFVGPADLPGATYAISTPVYADFSDPVDRTSVNLASFSVSAGGVPVPGIFDFVLGDTRVVFRAPAGLADGTLYSVDIAGVENLDGDPVSPWSSTFTTEGDFGPIIVSAAPSAAVVGTLVTLGGKGFDPDPAMNTVSIAGMDADVVAATLTGLTFAVPDSAPEGDTEIVVENLATTASGGPGTSAPFPYTIITGILLDDAAVARIVSESGSRDTDVSPDGALAYVTNTDEDWVTVIDLISLQVIGLPIAVGDAPLKIVVHPGGSTAYVTNFLSHTVSVIDLTASPPVVIDEIPVGLNPIGIAAAPDGSEIYVAEFTSQGVSVIDADPTGGAYNQVVGRITTESSNRDVDVSPDGALAFVTGDEGLAIVNLDPALPDYNAVVARVSSETSTRDVDVSPDGALAFVTTEDGGIFVVDIGSENAEFSVVARTSSETGAREVEVSPDGAMLFVTNYDGNSLDVYTISVSGAGTSGSGVAAPITTVPPVVSLTPAVPPSFVLGDGTGENPEGLVFSPKSSILVVANSTSGTVSVFRFGDDPDRDEDGLLDRREALVGVFYEIISGYGVNVDEELNKWRNGVYPGKSKDPRERILNQLLRALDSLVKSLDPSYWLDPYHLDPAQGGKVFDSDRQVVQSVVAVLAEAIEDDTRALLQFIIDEIIQIEIQLVTVLLDETDCSGDATCQRGYDTAVSELARAQDQYATGQFENAVKTLKSAWGSAVAVAPSLARAVSQLALTAPGVALSAGETDAVPTEFALQQNFPNPFNPVTTIRYDVPEQAAVRVEVFDLLGRRVRLLVDGSLPAGYHEVRFDASSMSSGIYLARMTAGRFMAVRRMVLVK